MTDSAAVSRSIQPDVAALKWLAFALTPGMGPIRGHRLVQHFGNVERVFMASLTELDAAGLPAVSAQSVWEELPADLKLQLEANWRVESAKPAEASLFADSQLSPHEKRIYALLKPDESTQLDEITEKFEGEISSSEIFSILFALELAGKVKQLRGQNYGKTF